MLQNRGKQQGKKENLFGPSKSRIDTGPLESLDDYKDVTSAPKAMNTAAIRDELTKDSIKFGFDRNE